MSSVFTCGAVHQLQNQRSTSYDARTAGEEIPAMQQTDKKEDGQWDNKHRQLQKVEAHSKIQKLKRFVNNMKDNKR